MYKFKLCDKMNWKKIFGIDAYKVLIIMILLVFPYIVSFGGHASTPDTEWEINANEIHIGLPFSFIDMEYENNMEIGAYISRFSGSYLNFVLDIFIAYLIGAMLAIGYYVIKKE